MKSRSACLERKPRDGSKKFINDLTAPIAQLFAEKLAQVFVLRVDALVEVTQVVNVAGKETALKLRPGVDNQKRPRLDICSCKRHRRQLTQADDDLTTLVICRELPAVQIEV